jgi:hypothetical protein
MLDEAGHQCTERIEVSWASTVGDDWYPGPRYVRCPEKEPLEIHHEHYKQTPTSPKAGLKVVCRSHHHLLESRLRPWNAGRTGR